MIETMLHENPGQSENPDKKDADADNAEQVAGFCITVTQEGTRPLLVEVQALVGVDRLEQALSQFRNS
ncbi:MAG TPA: hypothetical protein VJB68_02395 [Methylophilaceae bacterium]|nr:hypothetical protein [Methylophilaceae bacterium]